MSFVAWSIVTKVPFIVEGNDGTVIDSLAGMVPKSQSQMEEEEEDHERVQNPRGPPAVPRITSFRQHVRWAVFFGHVRWS